MPSSVMEQVISHAVPLLGASDNVIHRQGAIEAIACIRDERECSVVMFEFKAAGESITELFYVISNLMVIVCCC